MLYSCDMVEHDGTIDVDSIGVANVDGSGYKMLAEGKNAHFAPDSKKIIFSNHDKGLYSVGVDGSGLTCLYKKRLINNLLVSPDGMKVAFTSDSLKTIYMIKTDGSGFTSLYESKYQKAILRFSDDGSRLYFYENGKLYSVDLNGNYTLHFSDLPMGAGFYPLVSPNGSNVLIFGYSGSKSYLFLRTQNTPKDTMLVDCSEVNYTMEPAKFISRSTFLYVYDRTIFSYNLLSGEKQSLLGLTATLYAGGSFYYSQDGRKIIYRISYTEIEVADIDGTSKMVLKARPSTSGVGPYQLSPDDKMVLFTITDRKNVY